VWFVSCMHSIYRVYAWIWPPLPRWALDMWLRCLFIDNMATAVVNTQKHTPPHTHKYTCIKCTRTCDNISTHSDMRVQKYCMQSMRAMCRTYHVFCRAERLCINLSKSSPVSIRTRAFTHTHAYTHNYEWKCALRI
jgi:hypothetical protein